MATEEEYYVMGVDSCKFGGRESHVAIVMKNVGGRMQVVDSVRTDNEKEFKSEVKRLANYYSVPEEKIIRETK